MCNPPYKAKCLLTQRICSPHCKANRLWICCICSQLYNGQNIGTHCIIIWSTTYGKNIRTSLLRKHTLQVSIYGIPFQNQVVKTHDSRIWTWYSKTIQFMSSKIWNSRSLLLKESKNKQTSRSETDWKMNWPVLSMSVVIDFITCTSFCL